MNDISTPSQAMNNTPADDMPARRRGPRPRTIAMLQQLARIYTPMPTTLALPAIIPN